MSRFVAVNLHAVSPLAPNRRAATRFAVTHRAVYLLAVSHHTESPLAPNRRAETLFVVRHRIVSPLATNRCAGNRFAVSRRAVNFLVVSYHAETLHIESLNLLDEFRFAVILRAESPLATNRHAETQLVASQPAENLLVVRYLVWPCSGLFADITLETWLAPGAELPDPDPELPPPVCEKLPLAVPPLDPVCSKCPELV